MYLKIIILCHLFFSLYCHAKDTTINAAVADGFTDGLHSKYLKYIADKLSMPISITTIPLARRLKEIEIGRLDIIVGLQHTAAREDEFVYINPSYESLSYRFYSLTKNSHKYKNYNDLHGKLIAVNRHSKYFKLFDEDNQINKLETKSLEQNIRLVLRGRTDLFIHYEESTLPKLIELGVDKQISKTPNQPSHAIKHFIAISKYSHLVRRKSELQNIVYNGIKNNDFMRIRQEHYSQLDRTNDKIIALVR
jgi:ABC-type amino acid transport substrate-binding protein